MNNKSFTLTRKAASILFAATLPLCVNAQQIGIDEALQIASNFFAGHQQHPSKANYVAMRADSPALAYTAKTGGVTDFYVFNNGDSSRGFVIVAGNHEQPDILGYSLEGTFDMDSAPENFKWWMEQYQTNGTTRRKVAKKFWHNVEPLIKTKWGQEEPFNSAIPQLEGYQPFVTGCTATAIAQVMNYYKYPKRGKGSNSYEITYNKNDDLKVTFSADFGKTTYDWNNMLDDYSYGYTTAQANAVGTLMYHIGVAEKTSFSSNDYGSSAVMHEGTVAMMEHFDYDPSMHTAEREHFTDEDWETMIYQELENGRPVLYSGYSSSNNTGGHGFIVHGYDAESGMFAINWGWKGHYDGYYSLASYTSLQPMDDVSYQRTAYNYGHIIFINIKPNEGGQQVPIIASYDKVLMAPVSSSSAISNYNLNRSTDEDIMLKLQFTPGNSGLCSVSFQYGLMFINRDNGHVIYPEKNNVRESPEMRINTKYSESIRMGFSTSLFQYNGVYEAWPAYSVDNGNTWLPMRVSVKDGVPTVTVTGGKTMAKTTYTLTYLVDGELYERLELEQGATIPSVAEPNMKGYTFSGWSEIPVTMPAKDVTVTGSFTAVVVLDTGKTYSFQSKQNDYYMTLSADGVSLTAEPYGLKLEKTDGGQYYITDGEYYVGLAGTDNWSMTSAPDKKEPLGLSSTTIDGQVYYSFSESLGMVGVDWPKKNNMGCWADKKTSDGDAVLWLVKEMESSDAIEDVKVADGDYQTYTIDGKAISTLQKGVNIIKYQNGTTKKVLVK